MGTTIEESKVVVPEGSAECALVKALLGLHHINGIQVLEPGSLGGTSKFQVRLEGIEHHITAGEIETVVLVADNDDEPARMWPKIVGQVRDAEGLDLPLPSNPWELEPGNPNVAIVMLPNANEPGTTESLIWKAMESDYGISATASKHFIAKMPTGQSGKLTTREKAKLSALLAATCLDDPSCMVHWMWQSNKPYTTLLRNAAFTPLVDFFSRL